MSVLRILADDNVARLAAGDPVGEVAGDAVVAAAEAFRSLREGLPY
ncbi:TetR/AcrR family transcriptional regulator [Streptomyces tanashiensis]